MAPGGGDLRKGLHRWSPAVELRRFHGGGSPSSYLCTLCLIKTTNKEYRPLAVFTGFNHHRGTIIFGAALLYDETAASFEWLFNTFFTAMSGKRPKTIFTDQDAAMAKAIPLVMPETYHRICTWHMRQNAMKHLGYLYKEEDSEFAEHLHAFINDILEEDEFLSAWDAMVSKYNLEVGILCSHALKVLDVMDIKLIPERYIQKRWTRDTKAGIVKDFKGREVEGDNKLKVTNRYRMLCPELVKFASQAAECEEASALVASYMNEMFEKVEDILKKKRDMDESTNEGQDSPHEAPLKNLVAIQPKGLKKK
ncbi:hypothetical protein RHMOL_Rhmol09G0024400 [Rhododendron molle]|uniref:Uncharacterized protein n=1 Tax=Rhododendron molle TaxID=49168 RepID=A0ACC0M8Z6_RHOML|nr:hypothetical protein RHMOL_Rhmol09G0024400 [Rhododendron molle]